jgi:hypothetical protein
MSHPARTSVSRRLGLAALLAVMAPLVGLPSPVSPAHAAPAAAAVPVALPAGQKPADWAEALAARGFVASASYGLPTAGPGVSVIDRKDYWEMTVRSYAGKVETVNVAPCTTAEEREDLLFYMSTTLGPAPVEIEPIAPVRVEPPVATVTKPPVTTGSTTSGATSAGAPTSGAKTTGTGAGAVAVTEPKTQAVPERPGAGRTGFWVGAGGGVGIRSAAGVVGDLRVDAGWYVTPGVRVGVGLAGRTAATLANVGEDRTMTDIDVVVEAAWAPPKNVAPLVGLYLGGASRGFHAAGEPVANGLLPILGAEVGVQIPLGGLPIRLEPAVRVQGDLRPVELNSETGATALSPIEVRAGIGIVYRPG